MDIQNYFGKAHLLGINTNTIINIDVYIIYSVIFLNIIIT
jgi:hypothetical protein